MGTRFGEPPVDAAAMSLESLGSLYQEIIVEHARRPRCKGRPTVCRFCQDGKNPLCGDQITVFCELKADTPAAELPRLSVRFEGAGCSISQASASMMCDSVQSLTVPEVRRLIAKAEGIYTGQAEARDPDDLEEDIEALAGVSKFPVRVKCAALAWKSLELLLNEHFDEFGQVKSCEGCCNEQLACATGRRLKVVKSERN